MLTFLLVKQKIHLVWPYIHVYVMYVYVHVTSTVLIKTGKGLLSRDQAVTNINSFN